MSNHPSHTLHEVECCDCGQRFETDACNWKAVIRCPECQHKSLLKRNNIQAEKSYQRYRDAKARGEVVEVRHERKPCGHECPVWCTCWLSLADEPLYCEVSA